MASKEAQCVACGAIFLKTKPSQVRRYCSQACYQGTRDLIPDATCEACGATFHPKAHHEGRFCSRACADIGRTSDPAERFASKVTRGDGCWEYTGERMVNGYGRFPIAHSRSVLAHRYAWLLASGEDPGKGTVNHTCDNRACVRNDAAGTYEVDGRTFPRFGHLFLADAAANNQDAANKGRKPRGERHWNIRLTDADILEVLDRHAHGESQASIADSKGVSRALICMVMSGKYRSPK
jgi:endogenous inhibitor of DNA gyrase (YacG/DUF329 family)